MSPFGATRSTRGMLSPVAKRSTVNPGGAFGTSASVQASWCDMFAVERVAYGAGRSAGVIRRRTPGACVAPVAERRGAGADLLVRKRRRRADTPEENEKSESHASHLGDDNLRLNPARALGGSCLTLALLSNHIDFIAKAGVETRG